MALTFNDGGVLASDTHCTTHYRGVEIVCCRTPRSSRSESPNAQTVLCHAAACGHSLSSLASWMDRCPSCTYSGDAPLHEVQDSGQVPTLPRGDVRACTHHASSADGQAGTQRYSHSPLYVHPSTSHSVLHADQHVGTVENSNEPSRHVGQARQNHAGNLDRSR